MMEAGASEIEHPRKGLERGLALPSQSERLAGGRVTLGRSAGTHQESPKERVTGDACYEVECQAARLHHQSVGGEPTSSAGRGLAGTLSQRKLTCSAVQGDIR
jgi:hypothetical protein